MNMTCLPTP